MLCLYLSSSLCRCMGDQSYLHKLQSLQYGQRLLLLLTRPEARQWRQGLVCWWHLIQHLLVKTTAGLLHCSTRLCLLHGLLLVLGLLLCVSDVRLCYACACISTAALCWGCCCSILRAHKQREGRPACRSTSELHGCDYQHHSCKRLVLT